jgi:hypothetical protein
MAFNVQTPMFVVEIYLKSEPLTTMQNAFHQCTNKISNYLQACGKVQRDWECTCSKAIHHLTALTEEYLAEVSTDPAESPHKSLGTPYWRTDS